ncbi:hypothetical protein [Gimesia aquarii]|nr:hypothetical protein [Gimesia aquarii]
MLTKSILAIFTTIIGIALGAVIGFYGLYYHCLMMDTIHGGTGPGGAVGAGWALLFITIPLGMLLGGGLGCFLPLYILRKKK